MEHMTQVAIAAGTVQAKWEAQPGPSTPANPQSRRKRAVGAAADNQSTYLNAELRHGVPVPISAWDLDSNGDLFDADHGHALSLSTLAGGAALLSLPAAAGGASDNTIGYHMYSVSST